MNMDFVFYSRSLSNVMKRVGIMEMAIPRPLSVLEFITWEKKKSVHTDNSAVLQYYFYN